MGRHIDDFACHGRKLAIEIDGIQHQVRRTADEARSKEMAERGYRVICFWNTKVLTNTDGVVERILLESSPPRPGKGI